MTARPKVLLVEGRHERRVFPYLLEKAGVAWPKEAPPVFIDELGGDSNLLAPGVIEAELKATSLVALGIVLDADANFDARWEQISGRIQRIVPGFQSTIDPAGAIFQPTSGARVGAWIMPDNSAPGMLETLLLAARNGAPSLNQHVQEATHRAREVGARYRDAHLDKAELHTWLAWQDPPGLQLHQAVGAGLITHEYPGTEAFVAWFRRLFQI